MLVVTVEAPPPHVLTPVLREQLLMTVMVPVPAWQIMLTMSVAVGHVVVAAVVITLIVSAVMMLPGINVAPVPALVMLHV